MINLDLVKQFADLKKQLVSNGVFGFYSDSIQVSASDLIKLPNVQFESFGDEKYPFQAFVIVDGLKLFGLMTKEDWYSANGFMVEDVKFEESGDRIA
jgi:hypothetical protein